MQEIRRDGSEVLTPNVSIETMMKALENPENTRVAVYPAGSVLESKGRKYYVTEDGSLVPIPARVTIEAALKSLRK